jgi:hypothetical protein
MDKKIRENTTSIKVNFYDIMDREISPTKQQKNVA